MLPLDDQPPKNQFLYGSVLGIDQHGVECSFVVELGDQIAVGTLNLSVDGNTLTVLGLFATTSSSRSYMAQLTDSAVSFQQPHR